MYRGAASVVRIFVRGSAVRPRTTSRRSGGFTVLELMIALTVLIIGIAGILAMQMTGMRSSAYARHATEASVLAEDKMEVLRTVSLATYADGSEDVNSQGVVDGDGMKYTREWTIVDNGDGLATLTVTVGWLEGGDLSDSHAVVLTTRRIL